MYERLNEPKSREFKLNFDAVQSIRPASLVGITAALLVMLFLATLFVPRQDNHLLTADGAFYYSYMHSLILDGDFNVANDVALYNARVKAVGSVDTLSQGLYHFSIGPGIAWAIPFMAGRGIVWALDETGLYHAGFDGYTWIEEGGVCLWNSLLVLAALVILYRVLLRFFSPKASLAAIVGTLLATSLLYYTAAETWSSHNTEFLSVVVLLWLVTESGPQTAFRWFVAGISLGMVFLVRWQNIVFAILPGLRLLQQWTEDTRPRDAALLNIGLVCAGFVPVAFLQMLFWKMTLGQWFVVPQGAGFLDVTHPHVFDVLFSTRHGFILWTPYVLIGLAGLVLLPDRVQRGSFMAVIIAAMLICAVVTDWWAGESFGMRRLIGILPLIAFGSAAVWDKLKTKRSRRLMTMVTAALIVWNGAFMVQYALKLIPRNDYLTLDQLVTQKLMLPVNAVEWLTRSK